jgi:GT2 family glycosyltransferase
MSGPDVSIVIPTYRRPDMLARLLRSLLPLPAGTEVIVVNDGTGQTPGYGELVEWAKERFERFIYIDLLSNQGAPAARNTGIRAANGAWIALVDDDDEWLPGKLQQQWAVAQAVDSQLGLVYCWTRVVNERGEIESRSTPQVRGHAAGEILRTNFILSPTVLIRRTVFDRVGCFDETLPSCQDWDMWTRILCAGYTCQVVPEELAIYHRHGGASIGLSARAQQGYVMYLRKHWRAILRHTGPINWLRKAMLYARLTLGAS